MCILLYVKLIGVVYFVYLWSIGGGAFVYVHFAICENCIVYCISEIYGPFEGRKAGTLPWVYVHSAIC